MSSKKTELSAVEKQKQEEALAHFYRAADKALRRFYYYAKAFPNSNVTKLTVDTSGDPSRDTAWWNQRDGSVTFSRTLLEAFDFREDLLEFVINHETAHSSFTKYWLESKELNWFTSVIMNHLEDWRLNTFLVSQFPHLTPYTRDCYAALDAMRDKSKAARRIADLAQIKKLPPDQQKKMEQALEDQDKPTKEVSSGFVLNFWSNLGSRTAYANFPEQLEAYIGAKEFSPEQETLIGRLKPHILGFQAQQPEFFDPAGNKTRSLVALHHCREILKILNEYQVIPEELTAAQLLKMVKEELKKRGAKSDGKEKGKDGKSPGEGEGEGEGKDSKDGKGKGSAQGEGSGAGEGEGEGAEGSGEGEGEGSGKGSGSKPGSGSSSGEGSPSKGGSTPAESKAKKELEGMSTSELEDLKDALEKANATGGKDGKGSKPEGAEEAPAQDSKNAYDHSSGGEFEGAAEHPDAKEKGKESGAKSTSAGGTDTEYLPFEGYVEPKDVKAHQKFLETWGPEIARIAKTFANAKAQSNMEQGHKSVSHSSGHRLRIRSVARQLSNPRSDAKIFYSRSGAMAPGHARTNFEDILIGMDCSGSMSTAAPMMRSLVGLTYLALRRSKTRCGICATDNDRPKLISRGLKLERPEPVITLLNDLSVNGDVDMANGSVQLLRTIQNKGSDPKNSRLIIFTDCCAHDRDATQVAAAAKAIGYPVCIVVIGSNDHYIGRVMQLMPASSFISIPHRMNDKEILTFMKVFARWMAHPESFYQKSKAQHKGITPGLTTTTGIFSDE
jgi:hypothetical protein